MNLLLSTVMVIQMRDTLTGVDHAVEVVYDDVAINITKENKPPTVHIL